MNIYPNNVEEFVNVMFDMIKEQDPAVEKEKIAYGQVLTYNEKTALSHMCSKPDVGWAKGQVVESVLFVDKLLQKRPYPRLFCKCCTPLNRVGN